ncbi:MAG: hypothetical protein QM656_11330 [Paracoccaceae bacterium]
MLPREWPRRKVWGMLALAALGGAVYAAVEGEVPPPLPMRLALICGIGLALTALAVLVMTLGAHHRARARLPVEGSAETGVHGDHLAVRQGGRLFRIAPETIRSVVVTDHHVFVDAPPEVAILPLAAFGDGARMRVFAEHWDRLSRDSVP